MRRKVDRLEPAVRISRKCFACGASFTLSHPNSPRLLCDDCQKVLGEMIMKRKDEQQKAGN